MCVCLWMCVCVGLRASDVPKIWLTSYVHTFFSIQFAISKKNLPNVCPLRSELVHPYANEISTKAFSILTRKKERNFEGESKGKAKVFTFSFQPPFTDDCAPHFLNILIRSQVCRQFCSFVRRGFSERTFAPRIAVHLTNTLTRAAVISGFFFSFRFFEKTVSLVVEIRSVREHMPKHFFLSTDFEKEILWNKNEIFYNRCVLSVFFLAK